MAGKWDGLLFGLPGNTTLLCHAPITFEHGSWSDRYALHPLLFGTTSLLCWFCISLSLNCNTGLWKLVAHFFLDRSIQLSQSPMVDCWWSRILKRTCSTALDILDDDFLLTRNLKNLLGVWLTPCKYPKVMVKSPFNHYKQTPSW